MSVVQYRARIVATDGKFWKSPWFEADEETRVPAVIVEYAKKVESLYVGTLNGSPTRGRKIEIHRRELVPTEPTRIFCLGRKDVEEQLECVGEVSFPVVHVKRQRDGSLTRVDGDETRRVLREDGLSADEGYVKDALSDAARGFARLAVQHPAEGREFTDGIHRCQSILAVRACRRAFPAGWPDKGSGQQVECDVCGAAGIVRRSV